MKKDKKTAIILCGILFISFALFACQMNNGPKPIKYGKDQCAYCKMTISDQRFGTQLQTKKGRIYNFDDVQCMLAFVKAQTVKQEEVQEFFLPDYITNKLLPAKNLYYLKSEELKSPMRGDIAAFENKADLEKTKATTGGEILQWNDLWN